MHGEYAADYQRAIVTEIKELMRQKTWKHVNHSDVPLKEAGNKRIVLKCTWVFKLKRLPDGSPHKFKARYCVRGGM